jgi:hypothetical protein
VFCSPSVSAKIVPLVLLAYPDLIIAVEAYAAALGFPSGSRRTFVRRI